MRPRRGLGKRADRAYTADVATMTAHQLAVEIARIAVDHKGEDVVALDLRGISSVMDYTVICTGTSSRQMKGLADRVREHVQRFGERPYGFCGEENATWIVIDYVDVVFHIFGKPYRAYYDLELLWGDAPRVDWSRSESA